MQRLGVETVKVDMNVCARDLEARDVNLFSGRSSDPFLVFVQSGSQIAKTEIITKSLNPDFQRLHLEILPAHEVTVECWDWDRATADDLIGCATCWPKDMLSEGFELHLRDPDSNKKEVTGRVIFNNIQVHRGFVEGSIVSMCQTGVFFKEGDSEDLTKDGHHYVRVPVMRVHYLEQRLGVAYSTIDGLGSAVAERHYIRTHGTVLFEPQQSLSYIDIGIPDDDAWEPIRDFVVRIDEVVLGVGMVGAMDCCTVNIVDDDIWPAKRDRGADQPLNESERFLPSCNNVDQYLTPDEISDTDLLLAFITERWRCLWPTSAWGTIWRSPNPTPKSLSPNLTLQHLKIRAH
jgi:hypothetical protein